MTVYNPKPIFRYDKHHKVCERCQKYFIVNGSRGIRKYCDECKPVILREWQVKARQKRKMRKTKNEQ